EEDETPLHNAGIRLLRTTGGRVRLPAVLERWHANADRLPCPHTPARRLRPRPAARDPAPRRRPDSPRPPGAAGRVRGGTPKTRRAGTPSRPPPRGSLDGSPPPQVCHSRPCANARGVRAHQSGEFLPPSYQCRRWGRPFCSSGTARASNTSGGPLRGTTAESGLGPHRIRHRSSSPSQPSSVIERTRL